MKTEVPLPLPQDEDENERLEDRAAIMEFDAKLPRAEAERLAGADVSQGRVDKTTDCSALRAGAPKNDSEPSHRGPGGADNGR